VFKGKVSLLGGGGRPPTGRGGTTSLSPVGGGLRYLVGGVEPMLLLFVELSGYVLMCGGGGRTLEADTCRGI